MTWGRVAGVRSLDLRGLKLLKVTWQNEKVTGEGGMEMGRGPRGRGQRAVGGKEYNANCGAVRSGGAHTEVLKRRGKAWGPSGDTRVGPDCRSLSSMGQVVCRGW